MSDGKKNKRQLNSAHLSQYITNNILEINKNYISGMKFHYVDDLSQVIDIALYTKKVENAINIS